MIPGLRPMAVALLVCTALASVALSSRAGQRADPYVLAVVPSAPPVATHTLWAPVAQRLGRSTGLEFRLKVYEKMSDFEQDISRGAADFLFSSPLQAVVAHQAQGYVPLLRGSTPVAAEIFVRSDSPIRTVNDLADKKIAFVGSKNLCSILTRHAMSQRGTTMAYEQELSGSTRNVITCVLLGKADAGATLMTELEREPPETRDQLRTILETVRVAPHPLSAHPRVPPSVREIVRQAALALASEPDGAELLAAVRLAAPVAADYGRDYQALEQVDVKGLSNWGR